MNRMIRSALLVAVLVTLTAMQSFAYGVFESVPSPAVDFDFSAESISTWTITVRSYGSYGIGFSSGISGDYEERRALGPDGTEIEYHLFDSADSGTEIMDLDGDPSGGSLLSGDRTGVDFDLVVPQGQFVPPGIYEDVLTATYYTDRGRDFRIDDQAPMTISVAVPDYLELVLVDTGGQRAEGSSNRVLSFGEIGDGIDDTRGIDLLVRANVDYDVRVASLHKGVLTHVEPEIDAVVPYLFSVDGVQRSLADGTAEVTSNPGPTTIEGRRYTLSFTVGDLENPTAGTYEDTLTFTVTAR